MQSPVIVVTGANGGVGYGICQRLLFQLSEPNPTDINLVATGSDTSFSNSPKGSDTDTRRHADEFPLPCEGLTLIMACRSLKRAEAARLKLLKRFDAHVEDLKKREGYTGHAERFRKNLRLEIHEVNLAMVSSIQAFAEELKANYPYISHLICNAGVAPLTGIEWVTLFKQFAVSPMDAITAPKYYKQDWGERSLDGYGWVWQCNVFGHYYMYKALYSMLTSKRYPFDTRVIWTSSLEARKTYDSEDWQLKLTKDPYGSSKYQMELISSHLDQLSLKTTLESEKRVRHFAAHPGVCSTNIARGMIIPILDYVKLCIFYLGRFFGSPNHTISLDKGAVSVVWLSMISLAALSGLFDASKPQTPVKFAAQTDWWGHSRVGVAEVGEWKENQAEAESLVRNCDELCKAIQEEKRRPVMSETATERM
ncbi:3-keto sterol reductase [Dendrothele bispora CBS 962.96]|uniref:3-keto sterol reductase n=1 Tax=Dendrothele bispora (strain CBS 962.96) TaxID=1314807 RepID=A0A4S8MDB2_DENBC|nr:3-keto sterol reductase [Dendrothele bispora CBS 962.96]